MRTSDPNGSHELKEEVVKAGREEGQDYTDDYELEQKMFEDSSSEEEVVRRRKRIKNKKNTTSSEEFDSNEFGEHGTDYGDDYDESNLSRKTFYQSHIYPMHLLENLKVGLRLFFQPVEYSCGRVGARRRPTSRRRSA